MYKIGFFESKDFEKGFFEDTTINDNIKENFNYIWFSEKLNEETVKLLDNTFDGISVFVNSNVNSNVLKTLSKLNIKIIVLRCVGFDMIDLEESKRLEISVARVPVYSPYSVAEFAITLLMSVNRKIVLASERIKTSNFTLNGLIGFDMHNKTIGVIGTGRIGRCFINIALGFGCKVLAYDTYISPEVKNLANVEYTSLENLFTKSDCISIHIPLTNQTTNLINKKNLNLMKPHCIIVNTSRGKIINATDLLEALNSNIIGGAALDVYENEHKYFFNDFSEIGIDDGILTQLILHPKIIIASHQSFLTKESLQAIASTTIFNLMQYFHENKRMQELSNYPV